MDTNYTVIGQEGKTSIVLLPCGKKLRVGSPVSKSMKMYFASLANEEKSEFDKVMSHLLLVRPEFYGTYEGFIAFEICAIVAKHAKSGDARETAEYVLQTRKFRNQDEAEVIALAYSEDGLDSFMKSHPHNESGTAY